MKRISGTIESTAVEIPINAENYRIFPFVLVTLEDDGAAITGSVSVQIKPTGATNYVIPDDNVLTLTEQKGLYLEKADVGTIKLVPSTLSAELTYRIVVSETPQKDIDYFTLE